MSDRAIRVGEAVDHAAGPVRDLWGLNPDAQIARLRALNRSEAQLAQAIRRMVWPSSNLGNREPRPRDFRKREGTAGLQHGGQCPPAREGLGVGESE